jgi:alpha-tubulin suppressor-like RCC1 family protein
LSALRSSFSRPRCFRNAIIMASTGAAAAAAALSPSERTARALAVSHMGFLVKKAVRTVAKLSWKRRHFRLQRGVLSYHKDDLPGTSPKHELRLDHLTKARIVSLRAHNMGGARELEVFFATTGAVVYAVAEDERELLAWERVINEVVELLQPPEALAARAKAAEAARAAAAAAAEAARRDLEDRKEKVAQMIAEQAAYEESKRAARSAALGGGASLPPPPAASASAPAAPGSPAAAAAAARGATALLFTWGSQDAGQTATGSVEQDGLAGAARVESLRGARLAPTAVLSLGVEHGAAVTAEGKLMTWGAGAGGQLGCGPRLLQAARPAMVPGALRSTRVLSVACGETHTLCVASGGVAYAFGSGEAVLGLFEGASRVDEPTIIPFTRSEPVDRVFAGRCTSAAITARGTALTWGTCGGTGRLALGPGMLGRAQHTPATVPVLDHLPAGLRVVHVALGEVFSAFLVGPGLDSSDGRASLFVAGALGVSPAEYAARREALSWAHSTGLLGERQIVSSLAAGRAHLAIVADGSVYTMGRGWLGGGSSRGHDVTDEPVALAELDGEDIVEVACGDAHTLARTEDGRVYAWGDNSAGQLGLGAAAASAFVDQRKPVLAAPLDPNYHAERVFCGADFSAALAWPGAPARRAQAEAARALAAATPAPPVPAGVAAAGAGAVPAGPGAAGAADGGGSGKLRRSKSLLVKRQSWRSKAAAEGGGSSPGSPAFAAAGNDLAAFFASLNIPAPATPAPSTAGAGARSAAELATLLALPLPAGWSSHYDGDSGHIYFSNAAGETSWERPLAPAAPRASSAVWSR